MRFTDYSKGYVMKLEPGEEFRNTLKAFVTQKRIPGAFFQGIGALKDVKLGHFNIKKNDYEMRIYKGNYELISASGNVCIEADLPIIHTHVMLSDENFQGIGGHLFEGIVSVTAEVFLFPMDVALIRKPDTNLNFKGLDLPHFFVK